MNCKVIEIIKQDGVHNNMHIRQNYSTTDYMGEV